MISNHIIFIHFQNTITLLIFGIQQQQREVKGIDSITILLNASFGIVLKLFKQIGTQLL